MNRYGKRQRTYRRKVYRARRKTKKTIQQIVNRSLRSNLEVKRYMSSNIEVGVSTLTQGNNWIQPFVNIAQGTNSFERIGNKIKITGLQMKHYFHNNTTVPIWVRICVMKLYDKSIPTTTSTVFMNTSNTEASFATVTGIAAMMRPFHPAFGKAIYNKVIKLTANSGEGTRAYTRLTKFIKFGKGLTLNFNETGTGATQADKQYVIGVWASEAPEDTGAGSTVEWSYEYSTFFTDA